MCQLRRFTSCQNVGMRISRVNVVEKEDDYKQLTRLQLTELNKALTKYGMKINSKKQTKCSIEMCLHKHVKNGKIISYKI